MGTQGLRPELPRGHWGRLGTRFPLAAFSPGGAHAPRHRLFRSLPLTPGPGDFTAAHEAGDLGLRQCCQVRGAPGDSVCDSTAGSFLKTPSCVERLPAPGPAPLSSGSEAGAARGGHSCFLDTELSVPGLHVPLSRPC